MPEKAEKKRWPLWKKLLVGAAAAAGYFVLFCIAMFYLLFYTIDVNRDRESLYSPYNYPGSTWVCKEAEIWFTVEEDWGCTGEAVVDGKKVTIELSTGVRGEIRDAETQCSLWMGYTEFSQDVLVLKDPYHNLLTEYDGRLTFVRQTDSAQNG